MKVGHPNGMHGNQCCPFIQVDMILHKNDPHQTHKIALESKDKLGIYGNSPC
jgi:hypothetical protein